MAETVLSAVVPVLIEKLIAVTSENIARYRGVDAEIEKCQDSLKLIQDVLTDASQKEITDESVKRWLKDLQHLAYDIDDVLDGWATEAMHREFTRDSEAGMTSKVRKLIPSCCTNFSPRIKMHGKLDDINAKLERLVKQRDGFGLRVEGETRPRNNNNRRLQSSVVDPSSIVGRQTDIEAFVEKLLSSADDPCRDQNYSIVPIVGMGGVGKTTLARLLYNEKQFIDHFELKAWVVVLKEFDSFRISREIFFQTMVGEVNKELSENFNLLQEALRDHLKGKRLLLVLDDIWSEDEEDWKTLVRPFYTCAPGSKIIITTRNDQLLKKLGYKDQSQLQCLSHEDALSLFARHALGVDKFDSHLSLKPYGDRIVKKCKGLPLALIALGTSLRTKEDEDSWKKVLESEIWKLPCEDKIIPALRLSYHDLSAPLKQLFAYCSLFPKDFLFDKEQLVLLWMAEGFLHQPNPSDSAESHLGHEFFDELLSRSFFQRAPNNESLFVMHDLMNDLATSVSSEFFLRLDNEPEKNIRKEISEKYRHVSFVHEKYVTYKKFEAFERAKSLRTFLATSVGEVEIRKCIYLSNNILTDLLPKLSLLRVLNLSNFRISEVPESIGTLRHLRYLNLSLTDIEHLPETVCNLYNLQTLILFGCEELNKLPNSFLKLKNLRHLDVRYTRLLFEMLLGSGELKSLQITLSKIIIGSESGFEIAKIKDFKNLSGKISIVGLEKVQNAMHAHEAKISQQRLSELVLKWSDELYDSRNEMLEKEVLNELKPCKDTLIHLYIMSYGGLEFPNWVGDPLFLHLKHVSLIGCKRCTSLPPLARLPSLKELYIAGLDAVEVVGFELFPSLEILCLINMRGLKKWSGVVFPCLQQLEISRCPNLVEVKLEALPSLNVLKLEDCDSGVLRSLVEVASAVSKLEVGVISGLNDVVWRDVIEYLGALEELRIRRCKEIRHVVKSDAVANKLLEKLRKLEVWGCDNLVSIGEKEEEGDVITSLRILTVYGCKNMERCSCPDGIEELNVEDCSSMTVVSFPKGGGQQEKLRSLEIHNCRKLLEWEWGGQKMNTSSSSMPMLEYLRIGNCCLVNLTKLSIYDCEGLESFPPTDNLTSLKELIIGKCPKLDAGGWVWPPNLLTLGIGELKKPISELKKFPTSLEELTLYGGGEGEDGGVSQLSHLLPSSLTSLEIKFAVLESVSVGLQHLTSLQRLSFDNCPNLKKVSQHLTSIKHLSFSNCPNMMDLPETMLPSLLSLTIFDCPKLKERWSKNGSYWHLISHIPCIEI